MTSPVALAIAEELKTLRRIYEGATPRQRLNVALQRINNPTHYPNELVTRVSAVEAFARSLIANHNAKDKAEVLKKYRTVERQEATALVTAFLGLHSTTPNQAFGDETWEIFCLAVKARNLLAHECTYLDAQKYLPMAHACTEVLINLSARLGALEPRSAA